MSLEGRNLPGATSLIEDLGRKVLVILRDGRHVAGTLSSIDQFSNLVLEDAMERSFTGNFVLETPQGCMIVRSDNIVMVAEVDQQREADGILRFVDAETFDEKLEQNEESDNTKQLNDPSLWDFE